MTRPRQWILPVPPETAPLLPHGRRQLERQVQAARGAAVAWIETASDADRLGAYLASYADTSSRSVVARGRTVADYAVLLQEWGVPGIAAPVDVDAGMAIRWSRSVTLAVLRHLRQHGHLRAPTGQGARPRARTGPEGLRCAEHEGESPRAGAPPAQPKVAAMAELPRSSRTSETQPVHFPELDLQVDRRSGHLQRLDAQAAVDTARHENIRARHALLDQATAAADSPARLAADDASSALRAAVSVLTALNHRDGVNTTALLDVDLTVDHGTVTARPHGELDLYSSPRLEEICVEHLDAMTGGLLLVDLSAVTFLDSSALAVLVEIHRVCLENSTRFALTRPSDRIRRLLVITQLDTVLDIV